MAIFDYLAWAAAFSRGSAFNYPTPFFFDLRGCLTLILVARVILSRQAIRFFTLPLRNPGAGSLTFFLLLYIAGCLGRSDSGFLQKMLIILGISLVMYFYNDRPSARKGILISYVAGCLIVSLEAILGVIHFGHLPDQHIMSQALGLLNTEEINHNTFGFTSMLGAVLLLNTIFNIKDKTILLLCIGAFLIAVAGVFFSTSRSSILGLFVTVAWVLYFYYRKGRLRITAATLFVLLITPFVIFVALYSTLTSMGLDILRYRLVNEPLKSLGIETQLGYKDFSYKYEEKAESIAGREQYAKIILDRFSKDPISFFIGGKIPEMKLAAHTMFLNILMDTGLFGLFAYLLFIGFTVCAFVIHAKQSEALPFYFFSMLAVWIFCQGQNRQFMYPIMFAFAGGFFNEIDLILDKKEAVIAN